MFEWRERRKRRDWDIEVAANTVSGIRAKTHRGFAVILERGWERGMSSWSWGTDQWEQLHGSSQISSQCPHRLRLPGSDQLLVPLGRFHRGRNSTCIGTLLEQLEGQSLPFQVLWGREAKNGERWIRAASPADSPRCRWWRASSPPRTPFWTPSWTILMAPVSIFLLLVVMVATGASPASLTAAFFILVQMLTWSRLKWRAWGRGLWESESNQS